VVNQLPKDKEELQDFLGRRLKEIKAEEPSLLQSGKVAFIQMISHRMKSWSEVSEIDIRTIVGIVNYSYVTPSSIAASKPNSRR
jgi:hypothetical protein